MKYNIVKIKGIFRVSNLDTLQEITISMDGQITSFTGRKVKNFPKNFSKTDLLAAAQQKLKETANLKRKQSQEIILFMRVIDYPYAHDVNYFYERMLNAGHVNLCILGDVRGIILQKSFKEWNRLATAYEQENPNRQYRLSQLEKFFEKKESKELFKTLHEVGYSSATIDSFLDNLYGMGFTIQQKKVAVKMLKKLPILETMYQANFTTPATTLRFIEDIFLTAKKIRMDIKNIPTSNMFETSKLLKEIERATRDKRINETLRQNQKKQWGYANNEFIAIVPTTYKELKEEGEAQQNCLSAHWLTNYGNNLPAGRQSRGIVFIRSTDDPDMSLITCDFNIQSLRIEQFLAKYNQSVYENAALCRFKKEYQDYLYSLR